MTPLRAGSEQAPNVDPNTEKLTNDAFKNRRVVWRITAAFDGVSGNATRKEKERADASNTFLDDLTVRVTYKK